MNNDETYVVYRVTFRPLSRFTIIAVWLMDKFVDIACKAIGKPAPLRESWTP